MKKLILCILFIVSACSTTSSTQNELAYRMKHIEDKESDLKFCLKQKKYDFELHLQFQRTAMEEPIIMSVIKESDVSFSKAKELKRKTRRCIQRKFKGLSLTTRYGLTGNEKAKYRIFKKDGKMSFEYLGDN